VDPAKEVVGVVAEVVEGDLVVVAVVVVEAVVAEAVVEEVVANQQQQQRQPPTHLGTDLKGYRPPYFEEIPSCSIRSNKNGDYTGPPTSITMT
jgi:hypothetical protein